MSNLCAAVHTSRKERSDVPRNFYKYPKKVVSDKFRKITRINVCRGKKVGHHWFILKKIPEVQKWK
jgi:hypothetical protein